MVSNYENSPDTFNDHFLSVAEKIMQNSRQWYRRHKWQQKSTYYLSKISYNPFPNQN
jgi:hypothetical protein